MNQDRQLRVALAQINTVVGDLAHNQGLILEAYHAAVAAGAQIVLLPELALIGYPPEDLLLRPSFLADARAALADLTPQLTRGLTLIGFAEETPAGPRNVVGLVAGGRIVATYAKCTLPNYGVFDEKRYFVPGRRCPVFVAGPWRLAVNICEDLWLDRGVPALQARQGRANLMLNLSASPYHTRKGREREALVVRRARELGVPVLQANLVGGQDELVFDGQALAADANGTLIARAPQFEPHVLLVDLPAPGAAASDTDAPAGNLELAPELTGLETRIVELPAEVGHELERPADRTHRPDAAIAISGMRLWPNLDEEEEVYRALTLGLADYVRKNGFRSVVLGVSGGIDSALTATIAVDALGPEAVIGLSMPSGYTSAGTLEDAHLLARRLGIVLHEISIGAIFATALADLRPVLGDTAANLTEENLQARIRGMLLMAFSNQFGQLVLATGNKSEVAVGYCTLYGDMVGGFSVLKDVFKTQVYRLARWRNARRPEAPPIPETTLTRAPSAELRPNQRDTDSLPPYEILDPILKALVEEDAAPRELRSAGFAADVVAEVFRLLQGNEYKRRQAAPGIKITPRAFGRDRRYPLTNRYRPRES